MSLPEVIKCHTSISVLRLHYRNVFDFIHNLIIVKILALGKTFEILAAAIERITVSTPEGPIVSITIHISKGNIYLTEKKIAFFCNFDYFGIKSMSFYLVSSSFLYF